MIIVAIFGGGKYAKLYYLFSFGNMLRNGKDESSSGVFQKKTKTEHLIGLL